MKCKNCKRAITSECFVKDGYYYCSSRCAYGVAVKKGINWDIVEEQKKLNNRPRINWKAILGMSLTRAIARFKAAGLNADMTYKTICLEHPELSEEMIRKLRIGVAARYGEMATSQSELKKTGGKK